MELIMSVVQWILDLGPTVMLPIIITLFGLLLSMGFGKALKSGLMIGIGFTGLNLIIDFLIITLEPVVAVFDVSGTGFNIVDMGWGTLAATAWAMPFAPLVVPIVFLLNLFLLKIGKTKTLNIDIWNYWHFIFAGAMIYVLTKSFVLGLIYSVLISVLALKLGDKLAPRWQEYFGLEGTTCTTIDALTAYQPIAWFTNFIVDKIPGLNKIEITPEKIQEKYGVFGDPAIIGLIAGALLAVLAKQPFTTVLNVGISIAAVMILMPRMVRLLMEGLIPISRAARQFASKRIAGQDINIGMDIALALGDPSVIANGIIMVPITVILALIIPGNRYFPLPMLAELAFYSTLPAMWSKGNIFRSVISTSLYVVYTIVAFNIMAPLSTLVIQAGGIQTAGLAVGTCLESLDNFVLTLIAKLFGAF
jgi:PTS system galactitol-specific IIC component